MNIGGDMDKEMMDRIFVFAKSWELLRKAYQDTVNENSLSSEAKEISSDMLSIMDDIESKVSESYREEDLTKDEEIE